MTSEEEREAPCEVVLSGSQVLRTSCTMWLCFHLTLWRPLLTYGYSYKSSCVIPALWCSALSISVPGCQKLQVTAFNPVRHRMLYTSAHMLTVDVKGLKAVSVTKPVDLLRIVTTLLRTCQALHRYLNWLAGMPTARIIWNVTLEKATYDTVTCWLNKQQVGCSYWQTYKDVNDPPHLSRVFISR